MGIEHGHGWSEAANTLVNFNLNRSLNILLN